MRKAAKTEKNQVIEIMERTGAVTFVVRVMPRVVTRLRAATGAR